MTIKIQHKRSAVAGKAPLPADLEYGEIAVNYEATDPALYVKDSANAIRKIGNQPDATIAAKGVVQLADAAAITAGSAGRVVDAAQLKAEKLWDRTGAALSPHTAGDKLTPAALPTATAAAVGGIKVGGGLAVAGDGTLKVSLAGALIFKGAADPAAAAPLAPVTGDVWVTSKAGTMHTTWTGIAGLVVSIHEAIAWDGTEWVVMGSVGAAAVTGVTTTAPLHHTGTATVALTIDDASATGKGVIQLATAAEVTAGTVPSKAVTPAGLKVELDKKANLASPALTGTPTAPTAGANTNTTQVATTAFVQAANVWHKTGSTLSPVTGGDLVAPAALPAATVAALGAIKVGDGLAVAGDGTLRVNLTGALIFKGAKDPAAAAPTGSITGDVWVMSKAGVAAASWVGIAGSALLLHEAVAWDGTEWVVMGSVGAAAVTAITTTAPLQKTGTSSVALTIDSASESARGVVELATAAETTAGIDAARAVHPAGLKVELDKKAALASPTFTGTPAAPTAAIGTNTTQLATTAFVHAATPKQATAAAAGVVTLADVAAITAGTAGRVVDAAQVKTTYLAKETSVNSSGAVNATGTVIRFDNIPPWAKRISVQLSGVSLNDTGLVVIQCGSGSTLPASYASSYQVCGTAGGDHLNYALITSANNQAADTRDGIVDIYKLADGPTCSYAVRGLVGLSATAAVVNITASVGGFVCPPIDHILITSNASRTFDLGNISVSWDG